MTHEDASRDDGYYNYRRTRELTPARKEWTTTVKRRAQLDRIVLDIGEAAGESARRRNGGEDRTEAMRRAQRSMEAALRRARAQRFRGLHWHVR